MPRRSRIAVVLLVSTSLALAAALAWAGREPPSRIPLSPGRTLQVLKVTLGTNHSLSLESPWKQSMRRILPASKQTSVGPFIGYNFDTSREELIVWFDQFTPVSPASAPFEAVLEDGSIVPGCIRQTPSFWQPTCVAFACFNRSTRFVQLRVHDGTNLIPFAVVNPQPIRATTESHRPHSVKKLSTQPPS